MVQLAENLLAHGRAAVRKPLPYQFTKEEESVIRMFFTNLTGRVFLMQMLPPNMGAALFAMYSRLKNPRGIRGMLVDSFLPQLLASLVPQIANPIEVVAQGDPKKFNEELTKYFREHNLKRLDDFIRHSPATEAIYREFREAVSIDPEFLTRFSASEKVRGFLFVWLDKYGHNSIARTGTVWIGCEEISILAAKTIEWTRPGAGYIELSTRYVDFKAKAAYPIAEELALCGVDAARVTEVIELAFKAYGDLVGEKLTGAFPRFLRERYGALYTGRDKDLEMGVTGETFDVLGNLLPAATLTSVGIAISGESLQTLLKHLYLDNTPETVAIAECIIEEAAKTGAKQFARHYEPTEWDEENWQYLDPEAFRDIASGGSTAVPLGDPNAAVIESALFHAFRLEARFGKANSFTEVVAALMKIRRRKHDKLPSAFEVATVPLKGVMSFRGWRDLHRQGFSTHARTRVAPDLGFYRYDKPAPPELYRAFEEVAAATAALHKELLAKGVPPELAEYAMCLGSRVGFLFNANLRQHEFCFYQRSDWSVNHEVRQVFLGMHRALSGLLPWWQGLCESRVDATPAYVFARGDEPPVPLPL